MLFCAQHERKRVALFNRRCTPLKPARLLPPLPHAEEYRLIALAPRLSDCSQWCKRVVSGVALMTMTHDHDWIVTFPPLLASVSAVVEQIKLILPALEEDPGINSALTEICQILRVGFEDKIAQVKVDFHTFCFVCDCQHLRSGCRKSLPRWATSAFPPKFLKCKNADEFNYCRQRTCTLVD